MEAEADGVEVSLYMKTRALLTSDAELTDAALVEKHDNMAADIARRVAEVIVHARVSLRLHVSDLLGDITGQWVGGHGNAYNQSMRTEFALADDVQSMIEAWIEKVKAAEKARPEAEADDEGEGKDKVMGNAEAAFLDEPVAEPVGTAFETANYEFSPFEPAFYGPIGLGNGTPYEPPYSPAHGPPYHPAWDPNDPDPDFDPAYGSTWGTPYEPAAPPLYWEPFMPVEGQDEYGYEYGYGGEEQEDRGCGLPGCQCHNYAPNYP